MNLANGRETNAKTAYDYEVGIKKTDKTYEAKVGLMYLSDYYYSALPMHWMKTGYNDDAVKDYRSAVDDNWMYMGLDDWAMSPCTVNSIASFCIYRSGFVSNAHVYRIYYAVRPTFNLVPSVELASGSGTKEDPYRILL